MKIVDRKWMKIVNWKLARETISEFRLNLLQIQFILPEIISNSLSFFANSPLFNYKFRLFTFRRIRFLFRAFTIFFANQLSISRINFPFTINSFFYATSLRIHYLFCLFTIFTANQIFFHDSTSDSLFFKTSLRLQDFTSRFH